MVKKVKRGLYALRSKSGKRDEDWQFVVVEDPDVWLQDFNGTVIGTCVIFRTYQRPDNVRQVVGKNHFMAMYNFVTSSIRTEVTRVESANLIHVRKYKLAHQDDHLKQKPKKKASK
jgi:hypothetical protein